MELPFACRVDESRYEASATCTRFAWSFDQMPLDSRTFSLRSKSQQRHHNSEELRAI